MYHMGMKLQRQMVQFTEPQLDYLRKEAARLGVSISELVRRVIDEHREKRQ
jgi:hypothetical protein